MSKLKNPKKRFDDINVIPFIDIMLVLLVMVLTTATFINQGIISVDLPKAESSQKKDTQAKDEVNIFVKNSGEIYFDKDRVELSELKERLSAIDKDQVVVLRSDQDSKFQDFVSVMDTLKELKHDQLYIVTKKEN
ncbi:MAG: TonB system transport protein ExbD [Sulfurimonas sp.]|jgi:biopolymer transport protein ExbD|nr:TonB system transport protein ExbD [Sulfurimonadaceae bacterium]